MPTESYLNDLLSCDRLPEAKKPLVIYHGKCQDGFTAAWACWLKHRDWEFFPGVHNDPPPDVTGRDVYFLDFSYKRPVLLELMRKAKMVIIADHHKSAEADLKDIDIESEQIPGYCPVKLFFDMNHSGARLAWELFHRKFSAYDPSSRKRPLMIDIVEDRDLWRFDLPNTREISAVIFSYDYDFNTWTTLADEIESEGSYAEMVSAGKAIARKQTKDIKELLEKVQYEGSFGGYKVPMANLSYVYASEAGHVMCEGFPFAVIYFETEKSYEVSLRSNESGIDVSKIAAIYGGGGHPNAAGCRIPKAQTAIWLAGNGVTVPMELNFQGSVRVATKE